MNENTEISEISGVELIAPMELIKMKVLPCFKAIPELWDKHSEAVVRMINAYLKSEMQAFSPVYDEDGISVILTLKFKWKSILSTMSMEEETRLAFQDENFYAMFCYYFLKQTEALFNRSGYHVDFSTTDDEVGSICVIFTYEDIFNGLRTLDS